MAFILPLTGLPPEAAEVTRQVGYSIADVVAKRVFGLLIYFIARDKSEEGGYMLPNETAEERISEPV